MQFLLLAIIVQYHDNRYNYHDISIETFRDSSTHSVKINLCKSIIMITVKFYFTVQNINITPNLMQDCYLVQHTDTHKRTLNLIFSHSWRVLFIPFNDIFFV